MKIERFGQLEIGVVEHDGQRFQNMGATTRGRHVTAYTCDTDGPNITLRSLDGRHTLLDCRHEIVREYFTGGVSIVWRLGGGRFIAGYALDTNGMLFRGELFTDCEFQEAAQWAQEIAERCYDLDLEDDEELW